MAARARCQVDRYFSAAIDCRPLRFPYSTRRCGGEGTQEPEPPTAPVQSLSRLFKVVQSLKSVRSKSVQTFQISLRRRLRNTAFRRISSNNPERGCAMRLYPDDDLTGPTGRGHRFPSFTCTAGADAAVFPAAPALAASAVLKTAVTAGRQRTGTHAGGGLRARSPPPASRCCQHGGTADSQSPHRPCCENQRARQQLHLPEPTSPESTRAQRQRRFSEARQSTCNPAPERTEHPPNFRLSRFLSGSPRDGSNPARG